METIGHYCIHALQQANIAHKVMLLSTMIPWQLLMLLYIYLHLTTEYEHLSSRPQQIQLYQGLSANQW